MAISDSAGPHWDNIWINYVVTSHRDVTLYFRLVNHCDVSIRMYTYIYIIHTYIYIIHIYICNVHGFVLQSLEHRLSKIGLVISRGGHVEIQYCFACQCYHFHGTKGGERTSSGYGSKNL